MIDEKLAGVFSLRVYDSAVEEINRPLIPSPWVKLNNPLPVTDGFAYGVFRNEGTGEIVISYRGTDGVWGGFIGPDGPQNVGLAFGFAVSQAKQAAAVYAAVLRQYDSASAGYNISFTGHSLGGGLASIMAVLFDRPAIVFDPAPFQAVAQSNLAVGSIVASLGVDVPQAIKDYYLNASVQLADREVWVQSYFAEGEFLAFGRNEGNTLYNTNTPVNFGSQYVGAGTMHSQALLVAGLLSDSFRDATVKVPASLPLIMSGAFYTAETKGASQKNFLIDLIRSEQGTAGGGKLTHFAFDLQKLGANLSGLNRQAQDALIAQGIEWYYWQGNTYSGQEFFTAGGGVLQYTTATGAGLLGAQNKAAPYVSAWLESQGAVQNSSLLRNNVNSDLYQQWTVAVTNGVTASAQVAQKTQIFVGGSGNDSYTGGQKADLLLGGDGNDTLTGGAGADKLNGAAGADSYVFSGQFGKDVVWDSDGQGSIQIDAQTLGQAKAAGQRNVWTAKLDNGQMIGLAVYGDAASPTGKKLVLTRAGSTDNTITINGFNFAAAQGDSGYLGIKLDKTTKLIVSPSDNAALGQGNPFEAWEFDPNAFTGSSAIGEGGGKSITVYLNQAAKAGETLVLTLAGLASGGIKAVLGDTTVDANGAIITLAEGQTQVTFALLEQAGLNADAAGSLSVAFHGADGQSATSNSWGLNLQNRDDPANTITGDDPAHETTKDNLAGSSAADLIQGLTNDDALLGLAGDDKIEGDAGSDALMGGLGADTLNGGSGDDLLLGSSNGAFTSANSLPEGASIIAQGQGWTYYAKGIDADGYRKGFLTGLERDRQAGDAGNVIDGGAGNDVIFAGTGDDLVHGGEDNDDIEGMGGADVLLGDAGDDRIHGDGENDAGLITYTPPEEHGADFIDGGEGNDVLLGQGNSDVLYGGAGNDKIWGDDRDPVNTPPTVHGKDYLDGEAGNDTPIGGGRDDVLYGGADDDELWGDDSYIGNTPAELHGKDYLDGEDGDDRLFGGGNDDDLFGGNGNDVLYGDDPLSDRTPEAFHGEDYLDGEDGNDSLVGGGKNDILYGGSGNDVLYGDGGGHAQGEVGYIDPSTHGDDYLDGEDGDDQLIGEGGSDELFGGLGNDLLVGDSIDASLPAQSHGDDYLDGESGNDTLFGGGGNDVLFGGAGSDQLHGDSPSLSEDAHGDDYLDGEGGDDVLAGDGGNDTLLGGAGNDELQGGAGNDRLYGGGDNDRLFGETGDDWLEGGNGDDQLTGGDDNDSLFAGAGNDSLVGGAGNDALYGEAGDDQLQGGGGDDFLSGDEGDDLLYGDAGDDFLDGGGGNNQLQGGEGNDRLLGRDGNDTLYGGAGDDTLEGGGGDNQLFGGDGNDVLTGSGTTDALFGGAGNDTMMGGGSYAYLDGGDGNDLLVGGAGNDVLVAGAGDDQLTGSDGNDLYVIKAGAGHVTIADSSGLTSILFDGLAQSALTGGSVSDATQVMTFAGGETVEVTGSVDQYQFATGAVFTSIQMAALIEQANQGHMELPEPPKRITGTSGNDTLVGGASVDYILGGAGADSLEGGAAEDVLFGEAGNDTLRGGTGSDALAGGDGNDLLYGEAGTDRLWGHAGDDSLYGGDGDDELTGGDGTDLLVGGQGDDLLGAGGTGAKTYFLALGDGADVIASHAGNRRVEFGPGIAPSDIKMFLSPTYVAQPYVRVQYSADDSLLIQLGAGTGPLDYRFANGTVMTQASLAAIAKQSSQPVKVVFGTSGDDYLFASGAAALVQGGAGNDRLWGSDYADVLNGGSGNDSIYAGYGSDVLQGSVGDDTLQGNRGGDTYVYARGDGSDVIMEDGNQGDVNVLRFADLNAPDVVYTRESSGSLLIHIRHSADTIELIGWYGDMPTRIQQIAYADGSVLDTSAFDSLVQTQILRASEADSLTGTNFADVIDAGAGADTIDGRGGDDSISGGAGTDTYLMYRGMGLDTIREAAGGSNILKLATGLTFEQLVSVRQDDDLHLHFTESRDGVLLKGYFSGIDSWTVLNDAGEQKTLAKVIADNADRPPLLTVAQLRDAWLIQAKTALLQSYAEDAASSSYGNWYTSPYSLTVDYPGYARVTYGFSEATTSSDAAYIERASQDTSSSDNGSIPVTRTVSYPAARYTPVVESGSVVVYDYGDVGNTGLPRKLTYDWTNIAFAYSGTDVTVTGTVEVPIRGNVEVIEHIVGGPSANVINTWGMGTVDSGDGDDLLYHSWQASYPPGQFLYGGAGNDVIFGFRNEDMLIGGDGDDYLGGGEGNDTYYLMAGENGTKIIDEVAIAWFMPELPNGRPVWNDGGRYSTDTVEFGAGIDLADVSVRRGQYASPIDVGWSGAPDERIYDTLDLSWGEGQVARVLLADASQWISSENDGYGIEYFKFADGTVFTLAEMEALAGSANHTPTVQRPIEAQETSEDVAWAFTVPADVFVDEDAADSPTYSATRASGEALPGWLSFDPYTRTFRGTPVNADVGSVTLKVTATDPQGLSASSEFALTVTNVNDAPLAMSALPAAVVDEDGYWSFSIPSGTFSDPDIGDRLILSAELLNGAPLPDWLRFDGTTQTLHGTPRNEDVGQLSLKIAATDLAGAEASVVLILTVRNTNDAPEVRGAIGAQFALEDAPFAFTVPAVIVDPDVGDMLTYSAGLANGALLPSWLSFEAATNTFTGTPTNNEVGDLSISLTAADQSGLSVMAGFVLSVVNTNDAPVPKAVPADVTVVEGADLRVVFPVGLFEDVDVGDSLSWTVTRADGGLLPNWLQFDGPTRTLAGTPPNFETGFFDLSVRVDDLAGASSSQRFNVLVAENPLITTVGTNGTDVLVGTDGADRLVGGAGVDILRGGAGGDLLVGGPGRDRLEGGTGGDIYRFGLGDGIDTVVESGSLAGDIDIVKFGAGIVMDMLWFRAQGQHLEISVLGTSDSLTVHGWSIGADRRIEFIELEDGRTLSSGGIEQLVQAMAQSSKAGVVGVYDAALTSLAASLWN